MFKTLYREFKTDKIKTIKKRDISNTFKALNLVQKWSFFCKFFEKFVEKYQRYSIKKLSS